MRNIFLNIHGWLSANSICFLGQERDSSRYIDVLPDFNVYIREGERACLCMWAGQYDNPTPGPRGRLWLEAGWWGGGRAPGIPFSVRSSLQTPLCAPFLVLAGGGGAARARRAGTNISKERGGGSWSSRAGQNWQIFLLYSALLFLNAAADNTHQFWKLTDPGKLIVVLKHFLLLVPRPASQDAFS